MPIAQASTIFFVALKAVTDNLIIQYIYWLTDVLLIGAFVLGFLKRNAELISKLLTLILLTSVPKFFSSLVLLITDLIRVFQSSPSRLLIISQIVIVLAVALFFLLFLILNWSRHYYRVRKITLHFSDLPKIFDGFTLTHLSDIHSGSFSSTAGVKKGIDLVNAQKSDIILFTGDLVNYQANEMEPWSQIFSQLKAPFGLYSVLGNHDYGDYVPWENESDQTNNFNRIKQVHQEIGFKFLLNESILIQKADESISLIGVENWGAGNFHQYGDLGKAIANVPDKSFKILMSHDPSHWEAVVINHIPIVHLTLSGHTHGMQFGFEMFGLRWSPIKYVYKQWAGLYERYGRYLYVNRGFGFLGLKGRIGIWAEITVITLKSK